MTILALLFFLGPLLDSAFDDTRGISYYIPLTCDGQRVYPLRFLLVFTLDVLSAFTDMIIFLVSPRIENKRKRLKMARQADINAQFEKRATFKHERKDSNSHTTELPKGRL